MSTRPPFFPKFGPCRLVTLADPSTNPLVWAEPTDLRGILPASQSECRLTRSDRVSVKVTHLNGPQKGQVAALFLPRKAVDQLNTLVKESKKKKKRNRHE